MQSKQAVGISAPKNRMLQFEKESFLCSNGEHDCGSVYLWRKKWLCGPCLKDALKAAGASPFRVYTAMNLWKDDGFSPERVMSTGKMRCITPKKLRPGSSQREEE